MREHKIIYMKVILKLWKAILYKDIIVFNIIVWLVDVDSDDGDDDLISVIRYI